MQNLYHGSKTSGIKALTPFPHGIINGESGAFATTDIRFALAMIHGSGKELDVGYVTDSNTSREQMYIREVVPGALEILSAPGSVYLLEDSGFQEDERLSHVELISPNETKVISEDRIENILDELRKYDIDFIGFGE